MDYDRIAFERLLDEDPDAHDPFCTPDETRSLYDNYVAARNISGHIARPYADPWFYKVSAGVSDRGGDALLQAHAAAADNHRLFMQGELRMLRRYYLRNTIFTIDMSDDIGNEEEEEPKEEPPTLSQWPRGIISAKSSHGNRYALPRTILPDLIISERKEDKEVVRSFFTPYVDHETMDVRARYVFNLLSNKGTRAVAIAGVFEDLLVEFDKIPPEDQGKHKQRPTVALYMDATDISRRFAAPAYASDYDEVVALAKVEQRDYWDAKKASAARMTDAEWIENVDEYPWKTLRELARRGSWVAMAHYMNRASTSGKLPRDIELLKTIIETLDVCRGREFYVPENDEYAWSWWSTMRYMTADDLRGVEEGKFRSLLASVRPKVYDPTLGSRDYEYLEELDRDKKARKVLGRGDESYQLWERGMPGVSTYARSTLSTLVGYSGVFRVFAVLVSAWGLRFLVERCCNENTQAAGW